MSHDDANDVIAMATHVCKHNQSILPVAKEVITDLLATGASYLHDHLVFALKMPRLSKRKQQLNRVRGTKRAKLSTNSSSSQNTPPDAATTEPDLPVTETTETNVLTSQEDVPSSGDDLSTLSQPGPSASQPDRSHDSSSSTSDSEPSNSSEETESDSSGKLIHNSYFPLVYLKELSEY